MEGEGKESPDSVKKYILGKPEEKRGDAYRELVGFLLPEEDRLYHQKDVNDPSNLNLLSLGLQRKENLEAIINKKKIPDDLTAVINKLPPEVLTEPNDKLLPFLSPLEQKVLSGASASKDLDDFLVKKSLLAIAYNRKGKEEPEFYPELSPSDPDSVKKYILAQPEAKRGEAYRELVDFLIPKERRLYNQTDINGPESLRLLSLALERKNNLEAIINKKNIPENLTVIFGKAPPEIVSQPIDKLMPFLSPVEQKVLTTASENKNEDVDDFLVKQSLLALAFNRSLH